VPEAKPPRAGRRIAAALRALTGRRPKVAAEDRTGEAVAEDLSGRAGAEDRTDGEPDAAEDTPAPTSGEEAAARIDAARARLRATIAAPDDDEESPENEKRGP
jgi:hypothetical protein